MKYILQVCFQKELQRKDFQTIPILVILVIGGLVLLKNYSLSQSYLLLPEGPLLELATSPFQFETKNVGSKPNSKLIEALNISPNATLRDLNAIRRPPTFPKTRPSFALEIRWSDRDEKYRVCRLHDVCLTKDGSPVVHSDYQKRPDLLKICGLGKAEFFDDTLKYSEAAHTTVFDLLTIDSNPHIPHFLVKFLPLLFSSELLWNSNNHPSTKSICVVPGLQRCPKFIEPILIQKQPAILVHDPILQLRLSHWIPKLISMMPGNPFTFSISSMFSSHDIRHKCFNSFIFTNYRSAALSSAEWYDNDSQFFKSNNISRTPKLSKEFLHREEHGQAASCLVHILILNRSNGERQIQDLGSLIVETRKLLEPGEGNSSSKIQANISVEYFEETPLDYQIQVIQKADVIVAAHGAGMSNIIFARKRTPLLEIHPFLYYGSPFKTISKQFFLKHSSARAFPDEKPFMDCIKYVSKKLNDTELLRRGNEIWVEAVRNMKEWQGNSSIALLDTGSMNEKGISFYRLCARKQMLKIDVEKISGQISRMVKTFCNSS